jgi:hypothetical protein
VATWTLPQPRDPRTVETNRPGTEVQAATEHSLITKPMKAQKIGLTSILFFLGGLTMTFAQGSLFTYQGRLGDGTNLANGNYEILFRPFGVLTGGSQLTVPNIRPVTVTNGLFTTTLDFGSTIFTGSPCYLQLEIRTNGAAGYTILIPRQQVTPTPYAVFSGTASTVPSGAIGSPQLANNVGLGATNLNGRLDVYRTAASTPAISLIGGSSQINAYGDDGQTKARTEAASYGGRLTTWDELGHETAFVGSATGAGGTLQLFQANTNLGVFLDGDSNGAGGGGQLDLRAPDGGTALLLSGSSGAGTISVRNTNANGRVFIDGQSTGGGGGVFLYDNNGTSTVELIGAETSTTGSQLLMKQGNGTNTIQLDAEVGANGGGFLRLNKGDGTLGVTLQADVNGDSKVTAQVFQITGGADLSEQFDITTVGEELAPGTIVCIDPAHPGQLAESTHAYDRTVAGVVSGAGGVKPGLLMGQQGTTADGKHPVALTGRVYCQAVASNGAIHPGDLLTTSKLPGHAMKVTDYDKAHGAVLGKAMSSLERGEGLVLVLVSLE